MFLVPFVPGLSSRTVPLTFGAFTVTVPYLIVTKQPYDWNPHGMVFGSAVPAGPLGWQGMLPAGQQRKPHLPEECGCE